VDSYEWRWGIATSLLFLGLLNWYRGAPEPAIPLLQESLATYRALGEQIGTALALHDLGNVLLSQGQHAQAEACHQECLTVARHIGYKRSIGNALHGLSRVARARGDVRRLLALLNECLDVRSDLGDLGGIATCLEGLAAACLMRDDAMGAARLLAAGAALRERIGVPVPGANQATIQSDIATARAALGDAAFADAWAAGVILTMDEAVAYGRGVDDRPPDLPRENPSVAESELIEPLSAREREVAVLIAQGLTNPAIATALVISERTVHRHVANIMDKLDVRSRTQVALWATEQGLTTS
jgi:non-specific serine/threonine protein kinase